jgi:hypothetical protein
MWSAGDVEVGVVDGLLQRRVVVEHQRRAGVLQVLRRAGAGLDDAPSGARLPRSTASAPSA